MRMVQHDTMGEDRTSTTVERRSYDVISPCRHRHSSVMSSCSEDAESESTSAGYPSTELECEEELEYGPGIVNKLKTRYLSIALKQNRGTNIRRSCSMENLLDQDTSKTNGVDHQVNGNIRGSIPKKEIAVGYLKRAKSMDTLLADLHTETEDRKEPRIVRRKDGGLNRTIPMICDEELPKPDTVKIYKRMFEPAESRRGSYCRRPPVLRASAKSSSKNNLSNGVLSSPTSAKVNGSSAAKSKISAKQSSLVTKAQSNVPVVNGVLRKPCGKDFAKTLCNGNGHAVSTNFTKRGSNKDAEKELNTINRLLSQKEVHFSPKTEIIPNGNSNHGEDLKMFDHVVTSNNNNKDNVETVNSKPKIPPNKPNLKALRSPLKTIAEKTIKDINSFSPKHSPLKPIAEKNYQRQ